MRIVHDEWNLGGDTVVLQFLVVGPSDNQHAGKAAPGLDGDRVVAVRVVPEGAGG